MVETAFATAYELSDLANGHIANSSDDINRLLALFTAYLITAYRAGAELTRLQVSIINVGFLALVAAFSFSATSEALEAVRLWDLAEGRSGEGIHTVELLVVYTFPVGIVAIFAAFSFMWSIFSPMVEPLPTMRLKTPSGTSFSFNTSLIICWQAMAVNGTFDEGFQRFTLPQTADNMVFQAHTATGKLKAVTTPTIPRG